jgi:hypothetical protein
LCVRITLWTLFCLWPDFLIIFRYDANAFPRMGPIFQQPMRSVRHDLMGHFNILALAHWRTIVQSDIDYDVFSINMNINMLWMLWGIRYIYVLMNNISAGITLLLKLVSQTFLWFRSCFIKTCIIHEFKLEIALFLTYPGEIYAKGMNGW